jgi:broad specificity phosphatase PhoE
VDTAKPILASQNCPIEYTTSLREYDCGNLVGFPASDYIALAQRAGSYRRCCPENGESLEQLQDRAGTYLDTLVDRFYNPNEPPTVLLVTHGWFIMELTNAVRSRLGKPPIFIDINKNT